MKKYKCRKCGYKLTLTDKEDKKIERHIRRINDVLRGKGHFMDILFLEVLDRTIICCKGSDFNTDQKDVCLDEEKNIYKRKR